MTPGLAIQVTGFTFSGKRRKARRVTFAAKPIGMAQGELKRIGVNIVVIEVSGGVPIR